MRLRWYRRRIPTGIAVTALVIAAGAPASKGSAAQLRRDAVSSLAGSAASATTRLGQTAGLPVTGRAWAPGVELWNGFWHPSPAGVSSAPDSGEDPGGELATRLPVRDRLAGIWPNPVGASAVVRYEIAPGVYPSSSIPVRIELYDVAGRLAASLLDDEAIPGFHQFVWETGNAGGRLSNGVYLLRFRAGSHTATRRIVLLR